MQRHISYIMTFSCVSSSYSYKTRISMEVLWVDLEPVCPCRTIVEGTNCSIATSFSFGSFALYNVGKCKWLEVNM